MANDERLFSESEQKAADAPKDTNEMADRLPGAAEEEEEKATGRLPGAAPSPAGDDESDAPSDETPEHEHGGGLDRSDAGDGEKPRQPEGAFDRSLLLARIQHSTARGGLQAEVGEDGDLAPGGEPYNRFYENDDWRCCSKAENPLDNPFLTLYLDFAQHEDITPEMVQRNYELLTSFWRGLLEANKSEVFDSLGGRDQIREGYARALKNAYACFKNDDDEITRQTIEAQYQAVRRERDGQFASSIRAHLSDGVLDIAESKYLFETENNEVEVPLEEAEIADLLKRKLSERNFESWGDPQGDTLAERLRSVQWLSPERREEKREEAQKQREATSAPALKIGEGKARSVSELVELCDQNWNEAQDALFHGYLESWISEQLGEMKLTREVREIRERHDDERKKGLEKVVRLFCTAGTPARDPAPQLSLTPESVDFEDCPVGVRRTALLQFALDGPRRAWGIIEQRGNLPGLEAPDGFEITHSKIELQLDTLHVDPGTYEGKVVVAPEGGAEVPVPVRYRVTPLEIELTPPKLALGSIAYGKGTNSTLQVTSTPSEGRLVGTASLDPPVEGTQLSGELDGSASTLDLAVDTAELQAGSTYETSVRMNTNAGKIDVPVSFQVTLDWLTVGGWTAGLAAVGGGLMWLIRYLLADAAPILGEWFLSFSWEAQGPATLLCILVFLTVGVVAWGRYKTKGEERETEKAVLQSGN